MCYMGRRIISKILCFIPMCSIVGLWHKRMQRWFTNTILVNISKYPYIKLTQLPMLSEKSLNSISYHAELMLNWCLWTCYFNVSVVLVHWHSLNITFIVFRITLKINSNGYEISMKLLLITMSIWWGDRSRLLQVFFFFFDLVYCLM